MIIPDEIVVGFKKQQHAKIKGIDDVYHDGPSYLLGFATFMEHGTLRKKISWEGWRDKSIEPQTLKNIPREGFKFAEFNKRSSEWFGSGRTMFRVSDPYGFDLEITASNLMAIICNCNITEGQITGEFVWAWEGKELALLSVNSDMYIEATETTRKKNAKTIPFSEIKNGDEIETSDEKKFIYIGKCWSLETGDFNTYLHRKSMTNKTGKSWSVKPVHIVMRNGQYQKVSTLKVISNKPSGISVMSIEDFVRECNLVRKSKEFKQLQHKQPDDYIPYVSSVSGMPGNISLLSLNKIKIKNIVEKPISKEDIEIYENCKNTKGNYSFNAVPIMFSRNSHIGFYATGIDRWEQGLNNLTDYTCKVYGGKIEIDEKNDKLSFIPEIIRNRYYWNEIQSIRMNITEFNYLNWFRYYINVDGVEYLM